MTFKIKLLKSWEYGEELYEKGEVLDVDSETAKELIDQRTATKVRDVKPAKVKSVEKPEDGTDDLDVKVADAVKEALKDQTLENKRHKIEGGKLAAEDHPNMGFDFNWQVLKAVADVERKGIVDERLLICGRSDAGFVLPPLTARGMQVKVAGEMETGDGALGGFLVPDVTQNELLMQPAAGGLGTMGQVVSRTRQIPLAVNSTIIPFLDEVSRVDDSRGGGVSSKPTSEGAQKSKSAPRLGNLQLTLNKITALTYVSDELLEDSPQSIPALIGPVFQDEIRFKRENHIIRGTGAGQALGILNANALVTITKEVGQAADTIVPQNLTKMYARMLASSTLNAVFFVNQDTFPQLHLMSLDTGTAGTPVFMPNNSMANAPFGTILGRPIIPIEYCSTVGTVGDIIFADLSQYILATKSNGIQTATSIHLRFDYDQTVFRWTLRQDGQSWRRTTLTPAQGTNDLSPFVVLASRD